MDAEEAATSPGGEEQPPALATIVWHDWLDSTFELAQRQDKPILLNISCTWCHWCAVMDDTTFTEPQVATLIQSDFVPIRVDNDRRPDISTRYNMGGWPMTIFLTPTGELLYGGTYIPPLAMRLLLVEISQTYQQKRSDIYARLEAIKAEEGQQELYPADRLDSERGRRLIINEVVKGLIDIADPIFGGFGIQPKFPQPDALAFLQRHVHRTDDPVVAEMVQKILDNAQRGHICDQEEGGYFRYATRRDWSAPHYEKMLEINAGLLSNYLWAYQRTQRSNYLETALGIIGYVNAQLTDHEHAGFFASQAADEEYYHHKLAQREKLTAPPVDKTTYTDWNARMTCAYFLAATTLDLPSLREQAVKTLDRLWHEHCSPEYGVWHTVPPVKGLSPWLADHVWLLAALADAHLHTGLTDYLQKAQDLVGIMVARLWDNKGGGFFDIPPDSRGWGKLRVPELPVLENSVAAEALFYLARVIDLPEYREQGLAALRAVLPRHNENLFAAAAFAAAISNLQADPATFRVIGPSITPETQDLIRGCLNVFEPGKTVERWDPEVDNDRIVKAGYYYEGQPVAYVCVNAASTPPVTDPGELVRALHELREKQEG